jgi:hypothetical protein
MSKAAQARPPRLSARNGGQGFSLRCTERTPQTASSQAAGANPRRTPLIGKRAVYGWKLNRFGKPSDRSSQNGMFLA